MIDRPLYLKRLNAWKDKFDTVKVITGIRRCGKSKLLECFADKLRADGVNPKNIIQINFEDMKYDNMDAQTLNQMLEKQIANNSGQNTYIFLDEIQKVEAWEKVVASLRLKPNTDIYLTGSNAYMLSSELATFLSGRYVEIKMYPLSFKEFLTFYAVPDNLSIERKFSQYMDFGGMPSVLTDTDFDEKSILETLDGIYNTVLVKDVLTHLGGKDVRTVQKIIRFLADNIANKSSTNSITNTLYNEKSIASKNNALVEEYLTALEKSFIFYSAQRYDIKGKELLRSLEKYYMVDMGLRYFILGRISDTGRILENIVYFELLRRGYRVYIGKIGDKEIDFIALKGEEKIYYQVSELITNEDTRKREIEALRDIGDSYPKVILTTDILQIGTTEDGIKIVNLIDWLLEDN